MVGNAPRADISCGLGFTPIFYTGQSRRVRSTAKFFHDVSYCHKAKDAHRGIAAACLCALAGRNTLSGARVAGVALVV
jgi:hypothetical protein